MATPKSRNVGQLQDAIEMMDSMSQEAFSQIAALARLALQSMEQPESNSGLENIAQVLECIWSTAHRVEDDINSQAEGLGCNHVNAALMRRYSAAARLNKSGMSLKIAELKK